MGTPSRRRAALVAYALGASLACAGPRPPLPAAPPPAPPTLEGALAAITRASVARDLAVIAQPRHHRAAPEGLAAVRSYVAEQFRAAGLAVTLQRVAHDGAEADNVVGERVGATDRVVILGAHYDAVEGTPGADDNGTGVAVTLAAARATRGLTPDATVRFVAFCFEEQGLVGSRAYVASLPEAERARVRAALVVDMAGYTDARPGSQRFPEGLPELARRALPDRGDFLGVVASETMRATLRRAQGYVPGLRLQMIPQGLVEVVPDLLRGDHASFWQRDLPAAMASDTAEMRTPHYHQPSDAVETLDLEFTARVARWAAAAVVLAARGEAEGARR